MKEIPQNRQAYKRMKLNFYIGNTPKRIGGEKNKDFIYIDETTVKKHMKKRIAKQRAKELIKRPLLQTLLGFIEASRCKTLNQFTGGEEQ